MLDTVENCRYRDKKTNACECPARNRAGQTICMIALKNRNIDCVHSSEKVAGDYLVKRKWEEK